MKKEMKNMIWKWGSTILFTIFVLCACFPQKEVESVPIEELQGRSINAPAKVFLKDTSILLFQDGFFVHEQKLTGTAVAYGYKDFPADRAFNVSVPLKQIAALTYYQPDKLKGFSAGSVLLGITAPPLVFLAGYCLVCPKCCFGSCPTVYVLENGDYDLRAELFSYSVGRLMENEDIDLIAGNVEITNKPFEIRVTNEALETHLINYLKLVRVTHPRGTAVYPDSDNQLILFQRLLSPFEARNSRDQDVLPLIAASDEKRYRSPEELVEKLKTEFRPDFIEMKIKVPPGSQNIKLLLELRNTLLSTLLFYDMVLGSQGIDALTWTQKMNEDPVYASRFWNMYNLYSGIKIKMKTDSTWETVGRINDVGPLTDRFAAAFIPIQGREDIELKIEFFPDNFMIEAIYYDYGDKTDAPPVMDPLDYDLAFDTEGRLRSDLFTLLQKKDSQYLKVEPGEAFHLIYDLTASDDEQNVDSLFLISKGYYFEWLRGNWIVPVKDPVYRFNLNDISGTLKHLAENWLESKEMLEQKFFETRIPIRGKR